MVQAQPPLDLLKGRFDGPAHAGYPDQPGHRCVGGGMAEIHLGLSLRPHGSPKDEPDIGAGPPRGGRRTRPPKARDDLRCCDTGATPRGAASWRAARPVAARAPQGPGGPGGADGPGPPRPAPPALAAAARPAGRGALLQPPTGAQPPRRPGLWAPGRRPHRTSPRASAPCRPTPPPAAAPRPQSAGS